MNHSKQTDVHLKVLDYLVDHLERSKGQKTLLREVVMEACGVKSPKQFNKINSELFQQAEGFLYFTGQVPPSNAGLDVLDFYADKGLEINTKQALSQTRKQLDKKESGDPNYHWYESRYYEQSLIHHKAYKKEDPTLPYLEAMNNHLDAHYAENKLRLLCEYHNRSRIKSQSGEAFSSKAALEAFLTELVQCRYYESDTVEAYFCVYNMLVENSEENYHKTRFVVFDFLKKPKVVPNVLEVFLTYLMNQCIRFMNQHIQVKRYAQHYLDYVAILEKRDLFMQHDALTVYRFYSVLSACALTGNEQRLDAFAKKYIHKIESAYAHRLQVLFQAYLYKLKGQLPQAAKELDKIATQPLPKDLDVLIAIPYYRIFIEIRHALSDQDAQENLVDCLRKYLNRPSNKAALSDATLEKLENYLYFVRKLIKNHPDKEKRQKIRKEFLEMWDKVAFASWLETVL